MLFFVFFFFKQKTAYEMRISDWSSDVCSSDLLGKEFQVLASYGHVRDLIPKEGAVDTEHDFAMHYALSEKSIKHVDAIAKAAKGAEALYLATDSDREGEAISWHIVEILRERGLLDGTVLQMGRAHV